MSHSKEQRIPAVYDVSQHNKLGSYYIVNEDDVHHQKLCCCLLVCVKKYSEYKMNSKSNHKAQEKLWNDHIPLIQDSKFLEARGSGVCVTLDLHTIPWACTPLMLNSKSPLLYMQRRQS